MKKTILIAASIGFSTLGWAQKQNIQSANNYLRDKDYDKAIEYIEKAVNDPSTKDDPKAWYVRGNIYMTMHDDGGFKDKAPYREAAKSYMKANELKANYEKAAITQGLLVSAYSYYNDAANAYNAKKYTEAYDYATQVAAIRDMEGGKRYAENKGFDTVRSQAMTIGAYSAYYDKQYDKALPVLLAMKNDPIGKSANNYLLLADVYKNQNKDAEYLAVLEEGKKAYPDNQNLRNEELNYYIRTGKQDELMKKLEVAVAADPNNAELQFNLANGYNNMAFPKSGPKPANYAELLGKAEAAYNKALEISPNSAEYSYNLGVLYYNQATEINEQMNNVPDDRSAASKKRYDDLTTKRDAMFAKALPHLEKTIAILEPKVGKLTEDDRFTYRASLQAAKEIYARQNKLDKSAELKKKLEATNN